MHITIAHNTPAADSPPDEQDVMVQVQAVIAELGRMGHRVDQLACGLNLAISAEILRQDQPDLVFNLVESLAGSGRLVHCFPALLDAMAIPYTGASAESLFITSNKLLAKERLQAAGLPTPDWIWIRSGQLRQSLSGSTAKAAARPWIVKSVWEHASIGLDDAAVVPWQGLEAMNQLLQTRCTGPGGVCFAEAFIEGREFNLSVMDGPEGPQVLPPAEILFKDFEAGKRRIVDYRAKWDPASFEYHHTPRRFDFPIEERALLERLTRTALACWEVFELHGYARVDFRVDDRSRPYILEVNANPCLSPDAGFAAAVEQAGMSYGEMVRDVVAAGLRVRQLSC